MGFYLRAKLSEFIKQHREEEVGNKEDIAQFFATVLSLHRAMIAAGPYRGCYINYVYLHYIYSVLKVNFTPISIEMSTFGQC